MGKNGKRTPVCLSCAKRIRDEQTQGGIEDERTGQEMCYHARGECMMVGAGQFEKMVERGAVYFIHHYHTCGDEEHGFDCAGGSFSGGLVLVELVED